MAEQLHLQRHSNACSFRWCDIALHFLFPNLYAQYLNLHHYLPSAKLHEILRSPLSKRRLPHRADNLDGSRLHLHAGYLQ
jgi:hypothetical protein